MFLFKFPKPRRFAIKSRFDKPDLRERMRFQRLTFFQPRSGKHPLFYLALLILFLLFFFYLKGGRFSLTPKKLQISSQDAVTIEKTPR